MRERFKSVILSLYFADVVLYSQSSNQLQQLISVCTARETLDENERNTQVVRILFEKLERRGLFAFGRLDFLKGILSGIERQDLVMKVQDFEK